MCKKNIGGWAKNKQYHYHFTEIEKRYFIASRSEVVATIDNGAITMEMIFLTNVYANFKDERYRDSAGRISRSGACLGSIGKGKLPFFLEEDIEYFKPLILNTYLDSVELKCIRNNPPHMQIENTPE